MTLSEKESAFLSIDDSPLNEYKFIWDKISKEIVTSENEVVKGFRGKRTNKYLDAPINESSYPDGVALACRGTREFRDKNNKENCNVYKFTFIPVDSVGTKQHAFHVCDIATCRLCGIATANRNARRIAFKLLRLKHLSAKRILFGSLNIYNPKDGTYGSTKRDKLSKQINFEFPKGMDFWVWLEKSFKNVSKILKELDFTAFDVIFHADRIDKITKERNWSPHFHIIGLGYLPNHDIFDVEYGFNYTRFDDIHFSSKEEMAQLIPRISYYLNHAASYNNVIVRKKDTRYHKKGSKYNRLANFCRSYGLLSNNACKTYKEYSEDIKNDVFNDNGLPYVAHDDSMNLKSRAPKSARKRINKLGLECMSWQHYYGYRYKHAGLYDARKKRIYDYKLKEKHVHSKMILIENPFAKGLDTKIYLKDVERIRVIRLKGFDSNGSRYPKHCISSYELDSKKIPSVNVGVFDAKLDYIVVDERYVVSPEVVENIKIRFNEIKEQKKRGIFRLSSEGGYE